MSNKEEFVRDVKKLAATLALSKSMHRLDTTEEPGAWRVAYALVEIRQSISAIEKDFLPKLGAATDGPSVDASLHEIGESLRHVLYHVRDSGYFDYLLEGKSATKDSERP